MGGGLNGYIQCIDLSSKLMELHNHFKSDTSLKTSSDLTFLKNLNQHYSRLVFLPPVNKPQTKIIGFGEYIHYAATHNMTVNLGYFARQNNREYNKVGRQLLMDVFQGKLSNDTIYIILKPRFAHLLKYHLKGQSTFIATGRYTAIYTLDT